MADIVPDAATCMDGGTLEDDTRPPGAGLACWFAPVVAPMFRCPICCCSCCSDPTGAAGTCHLFLRLLLAADADVRATSADARTDVGGCARAAPAASAAATPVWSRSGTPAESGLEPELLLLALLAFGLSTAVAGLPMIQGQVVAFGRLGSGFPCMIVPGVAVTVAEPEALTTGMTSLTGCTSTAAPDAKQSRSERVHQVASRCEQLNVAVVGEHPPDVALLSRNSSSMIAVLLIFAFTPSCFASACRSLRDSA